MKPLPLSRDLIFFEKSYLAEVASDDALKSKLPSSSLRFEFWAELEHEFPSLYRRAVEVLLQFPTLCEKTFSAVTAIKTCYHSALGIDVAL